MNILSQFPPTYQTLGERFLRREAPTPSSVHLANLTLPRSLALVRHAESAYGAFNRTKEDIPGYREFAELVERSMKDPEFSSQVLGRVWPSREITEQATQIHRRMQDLLPQSDREMPLTDAGKEQAREAGERFAETLPAPSRVYVSPYVRTKQTHEILKKSWPALRGVPTKTRASIREQEHGLSGFYKDWRLLFAFHPEQALYFQHAGKLAYRHLNGENTFDVRDRVRGFLKEVLRNDRRKDVLAITHERAILSMRSVVEGWSDEEEERAMQSDRPLEASVTLYEPANQKMRLRKPLPDARIPTSIAS